MDTGAGLHHRVRHDWLVQLRQLRLETDDLLASGQLCAEVHRRRSTMSRRAMHLEVANWLGCSLLFEVEVFRAEELSSSEEARSLIEECANAALVTATSFLEQSAEVALHPEWKPELAETLGTAHRSTIASLAAADGPVPAYRWRLPATVYEAAWDTITRRWLSDTHRRTTTVSWNYLVDELHTRGVQRVLLLHHPAIAQFSCETDVTLLAERRFDWMEREGYLTNATFDWLIEVGKDGEWTAYD